MNPTFRLAALAVSLALFVAEARAVSIDWVPIGNPGNAADSTGYGSVGYAYNVDKYDVTNSQYVELLNAKDPSGTNALGLYSSAMGTDSSNGGIAFASGNASGFKYSVATGRGNWPVNYVTWYDAIRFANWMNNGQGNGDTETGAYTLLGGTPTPSNGNSIARNAGATTFLTSENEWYKAAYYRESTSSYREYATNSNAIPTAVAPPGAVNSVNYQNAVGHPTNVGAYTGTTSPYGLFDMAGNVYQWNESLVAGLRGVRGGAFGDSGNASISRVTQSIADQSNISPSIGFRLTETPEPSSLALAAFGFIGLAAWGWRGES